ncbi:hypothetical protein NEMBOFW57_009675 [Staphylotrichum longicolle]|uniref:Uncharacterized protein n=1 Tax=Staphylotrichum longicolle TaxID=669026 RepID=A0AAD4EPT0_9PEZI|nr:hypothetical protein NEMBOFW57_009675 [Staphylotrichum longicolle]
MPEHRHSDRTYQLDPASSNLQQQGGTYVPTGSLRRFWSSSAPHPEESRAPFAEQKSADDARPKADAATTLNEKPTETKKAAAAAGGAPPRSNSSLPPAPATKDSDDALWVVVPDANAAAGDDDSDKQTIMEFNFWLGWGRWKHKLIGFKAWESKKT